MDNFPSLWSNRSPSRPQHPFQSLSRMQQEIDRMFDDFFSGNSSMPALSDRAFQPAFDVEDSDTHYVMSIDLPGLKKEDVKMEIQDGQLRIHGERKEETDSGRGKNRIRQRQYGSFEQIINLPAGCKEEDIEAQFENGVLQVAIPKGSQEAPKQIQIGEKKQGFFSKLLGNKERGQEKQGKQNSAA